MTLFSFDLGAGRGLAQLREVALGAAPAGARICLERLF
jgi:hypothetical protein